MIIALYRWLLLQTPMGFDSKCGLLALGLAVAGALRASAHSVPSRFPNHTNQTLASPWATCVKVRHLIPGTTFEKPPSLLLVNTAPLLEEERDFEVLALVPYVRHP